MNYSNYMKILILGLFFSLSSYSICLKKLDRASKIYNDFYIGQEAAEVEIQIAHGIRSGEIASDRDHIPYFSERLETYLGEVESSINSTSTDVQDVLKEFITIGRERVQSEEVTADWYLDFNTRLTATIGASQYNDRRFTIGRLSRSVDMYLNMNENLSPRYQVLNDNGLIAIPSYDEIGFASLNHLILNRVLPHGIILEPVFVDGRRMMPATFLTHDAAHASSILYLEFEVFEKIARTYLDNYEGQGLEQRLLLDLFAYAMVHENALKKTTFRMGDELHEALLSGDVETFVSHFFNPYQNISPSDEPMSPSYYYSIVRRFQNENDMMALLAERVDPNNEEALRDYVEQSIRLFFSLM